MIPLLELAIQVHVGLQRWRRVHGIDCKLTIVGGLWRLKGLPHGLVDVALHVEPADRSVMITPFGPGGSGWILHSGSRVDSKTAGDVVQERSAPRRSFDGHTLTTPWDKLHELYFVGYAFLNYLFTPFLFAELGFEVAEDNPHFGAGQNLRPCEVSSGLSHSQPRTNSLFQREGNAAATGLRGRGDSVRHLALLFAIRDRWRNRLFHAPTGPRALRKQEELDEQRGERTGDKTRVWRVF